MRVDTQFSVFLINRPGVLSAVTEALAAADINLYALSLSDSGEHGVLRILTSDPEKTRQVLRDTHDRWTETDVLVLPMGNQPGAFAKLAHKLAANNINITYAYCTSAEDAVHSLAVVKVADIDAAKKVLAE